MGHYNRESNYLTGDIAKFQIPAVMMISFSFLALYKRPKEAYVDRRPILWRFSFCLRDHSGFRWHSWWIQLSVAWLISFVVKRPISVERQGYQLSSRIFLKTLGYQTLFVDAKWLKNVDVGLLLLLLLLCCHNVITPWQPN